MLKYSCLEINIIISFDFIILQRNEFWRYDVVEGAKRCVIERRFRHTYCLCPCGVAFNFYEQNSEVSLYWCIKKVLRWLFHIYASFGATTSAEAPSEAELNSLSQAYLVFYRSTIGWRFMIDWLNVVCSGVKWGIDLVVGGICIVIEWFLGVGEAVWSQFKAIGGRISNKPIGTVKKTIG